MNWGRARTTPPTSIPNWAVGYQVLKVKDIGARSVEPAVDGVEPVFDYRSRTNLNAKVHDFVEFGGAQPEDGWLLRQLP